VRTPAEIEGERAAAAERAYNAFFSQAGGRALSDSGNTARSATAPAQNDFRTGGNTPAAGFGQRYRAGGGKPFLPDVDPRASYVQLAAAPPGFWDHWSPRGCANCHGYTPGTLPPVGRQSPFPPGYSPRSGSGQGGSPKRRLPQCDVQYENDTERCYLLPKPDARARCWASASERRAYCLSHDGEVGWPKLQTR
jgi:hypothetical protein